MFKAGDMLRRKTYGEGLEQVQLLEYVRGMKWKFKFVDNEGPENFLYPFDPKYWEVVKPKKPKRYL